MGGLVAFAMVVSEFEVIRRVGVVTLSVAGIFKVSVFLFYISWQGDGDMRYILMR